jgi:CBS domain-containing protein
MSTLFPVALSTRDNVSNPELKIAAVMRTDFRSCNAPTPIKEAAKALRESSCPVLAVTRAQVPIGFIAERDVVAALAGEREWAHLTADSVMTREFNTVSIDTTVGEAARWLADSGGYLMAVDSDGLLKGIVTLAELGTRLDNAALKMLIARLVEVREVPGALGLAPPPTLAIRTAEPSAEDKPTKSPSQPHPRDSLPGVRAEPIPLVSPSDLINPLLTVADVMTADPRTCSPVSTALEAVMVFRDANCGLMPVIDEGRPIGAVTDRDVALALAGHETDLARTPVEDLMTKDLTTIAWDAHLDAAIELFGDQRLRRLLVVDSEGRLVGVLSWIDLVPHLSERGLGYVVSKIAAHRPHST